MFILFANKNKTKIKRHKKNTNRIIQSKKKMIAIVSKENHSY